MIYLSIFFFENIYTFVKIDILVTIISFLLTQNWYFDQTSYFDQNWYFYQTWYFDQNLYFQYFNHNICFCQNRFFGHKWDFGQNWFFGQHLYFWHNWYFDQCLLLPLSNILYIFQAFNFSVLINYFWFIHQHFFILNFRSFHKIIN